MHIPKKTMRIAVAILIVAIAVLIIGIISHNKTKSTNHKQSNDNTSSEMDKPDEDNVLDEKEYYYPDGMEVLDDETDETEESQETIDAPISWGETPNEDSSTNTTSKDTTKTNDDEDGLPDEEDRTETHWGTVF